MKRFEVYEMALQMIRSLRPAVERIRQHDRDLAAQLKRAGSSVPGNIAEGARRVGQDRLHHYRIAAGSAGEIRSHLPRKQLSRTNFPGRRRPPRFFRGWRTSSL